MAAAGQVVDGRFLLEQRLGAGTSGEAWRGRDADGPEVVVKLLLASNLGSERVTERFRREVLALSSVRHPHVVPLLAAGTCATLGPYYVTSWVPGTPLDQVLARAPGRRLAPARAIGIACQVLEALEAVHAVGVLHRDLKPGNLLLGAEDHVLVLDFGLAKHLTGGLRTIEALTRGSAVGTPSYMSPEQCGGEPSGPATDVYAVGCMLMELLTGAPPFQADAPIAVLSQHVMAAPPCLSERWVEAPPALERLVASCLEKAPEARPSASALRTGLLRLLAQAEGATASPPRESRLPTGSLEQDPGLAATCPGLGGEVGGYPLLELLGEGGFGSVYRTRLPDGTPAALKLVLHARNDPVLLREQRFAREVRLLRALEHPALPRLLDHGGLGDLSWAVMELIEGQDLGEVVRRRGRLPLSEVVSIARQVLPALDAAHMRGIVHCDVKPENIRLRADGRAFLLDLGIAKLRPGSPLGGQSVETARGGVVGSFQYLPPEFARGRGAVSPMADVYAVGAVMFALLAGRPPFDEDDPGRLIRRHVTEAPPDLQELAPDVPPPVAALVMRCLEKSPQRRPQTAGLLLRALEEALVRLDAATLPPGALAVPLATTLPVAYPIPPLAVGVLSGPEAGRTVALDPARTAWILGKDADADVQLPGVQPVIVRRGAGQGLEVLDPAGRGGLTVEGRAVGALPVPLARGAVIAVGPVLVVVQDAALLASPPAPALELQRADDPGVRLDLASPWLLGRDPEAVQALDARAHLQVSALHCRIVPRLGQAVLEEADAPNGTWLAGQRVRAAVLRAGDELGLGGSLGSGVARFLVRARASDPPLVLGRSARPVEESGDPLRLRLQVPGGRTWIVFAGTRLRFGRNRARPGAPRENDLVLRALGGDDPAGRTGRISGQHGALLLTADGLAVRDASTLGTRLDGKPLTKGEVRPLGREFELEVADAVRLRGRVSLAAEVGLPALGRPRHPVAAVRLERVGEDAQAYLWLPGGALAGPGADHDLPLPLPAAAGLRPGHVRLEPDALGLRVTPLREDGALELEGRGRVPPGHRALWSAGEARLGSLVLRLGPADDDDMLP